jgi:hypothetical protein
MKQDQQRSLIPAARRFLGSLVSHSHCHCNSHSHSRAPGHTILNHTQLPHTLMLPIFCTQTPNKAFPVHIITFRTLQRLRLTLTRLGATHLPPLVSQGSAARGRQQQWGRMEDLGALLGAKLQHINRPSLVPEPRRRSPLLIDGDDHPVADLTQFIAEVCFSCT